MSPAGAEGLWAFQPVAMGTDVDGAPFLTVRAGTPADTGPEALPTAVLRLRGDRWETVARRDRPGVTAACVTGDDYVVLTNQAPCRSGPVPDEPPPLKGPSGEANVALYAVPRDGGEFRRIDLPELDTSFGGVSVQLACDRSGPYLTSSSPRQDADMQLFARRGGQWVQVSQDWGTAIAVRTASSVDGVAVVVEQAAGRDGQETYAVASDDDEARPTGQGHAERLFVPAVFGAGWLTVGPLADLSTSSDAGQARPDTDAVTFSALVP